MVGSFFSGGNAGGTGQLPGIGEAIGEDGKGQEAV